MAEDIPSSINYKDQGRTLSEIRERMTTAVDSEQPASPQAAMEEGNICVQAILVQAEEYHSSAAAASSANRPVEVTTATTATNKNVTTPEPKTNDKSTHPT